MSEVGPEQILSDRKSLPSAWPFAGAPSPCDGCVFFTGESKAGYSVKIHETSVNGVTLTNLALMESKRGTGSRSFVGVMVGLNVEKLPSEEQAAGMITWCTSANRGPIEQCPPVDKLIGLPPLCRALVRIVKGDLTAIGKVYRGL